MIYLDNNATTRVDDDVLEAMLPYFTEHYANPSSIHVFADDAKEAIRQSRVAVGRLLGCRGDDLVFTSGATEAANLAIFGAAEARPDKRHIVTTTVEHHAVLHPIQRLEERGYTVTRVPVDEAGQLDVADVRDAIRDDTLLVAAMFANNETGVLFPVSEIGTACRERGALFLCDACQAVGKLPIHVRHMKIDYLTLSAHKFHGPKGVGALFRRRGAPLVGQLVGGGQQWDIRSGTENVPGIVGLGMAAYVARDHLENDVYAPVASQRDRLESALLEAVPGTRVNGTGSRLPNTLNLSFEHASGEAILQLLDEVGIAASSSSACQSNVTEPSHVLQAMRVPTRYIHGSVRFGLSRFTTAAEIDDVIGRLPRIIERARDANPFVGTETVTRYDAYRGESTH